MCIRDRVLTVYIHVLCKFMWGGHVLCPVYTCDIYMFMCSYLLCLCFLLCCNYWLWFVLAILFDYVLFMLCRMKCWHVLSLKRYGNGCRVVPGSDANLSVAPFYGEQPWMCAPRRHSRFPKWSRMKVVSDTQLLSNMNYVHAVSNGLPFIKPYY